MVGTLGAGFFTIAPLQRLSREARVEGACTPCQAEAEALDAQRARAQAEAQLRAEREAAAAQEQAMRELNHQVGAPWQMPSAAIIC